MNEVLDSKNLGTQRGFDMRVELYPDYDNSPEGEDWASAEQVAAWRRDDWAYGVLVVTASVNGYDLGTTALGGVVFGRLDEDTNLNPLEDATYVDDLRDEAVQDAEVEAKSLIKRLREVA